VADIAEIIPEVREKLPDLEPPPVLEPEQAPFRLLDSITGFLKSAAQSQPLILVIDDLHWADKPSLLLLQFMAREMGGSRLLLVGCYRDAELSREHPLSSTRSSAFFGIEDPVPPASHMINEYVEPRASPNCDLEIGLDDPLIASQLLPDLFLFERAIDMLPSLAQLHGDG